MDDIIIPRTPVGIRQRGGSSNRYCMLACVRSGIPEGMDVLKHNFHFATELH